MHKALAAAGHTKNLATLYRWNLPKANRGSGGLVPTCAQPHVMEAARLEGIALTEEDWLPSKPR